MSAVLAPFPQAAAPLPAPEAWLASDGYRACALCLHGVTLAGQRLCTHPCCATANAPQPVALVRRTHGACGPEALHLDFPGLNG